MKPVLHFLIAICFCAFAACSSSPKESESSEKGSMDKNKSTSEKTASSDQSIMDRWRPVAKSGTPLRLKDFKGFSVEFTKNGKCNALVNGKVRNTFPYELSADGKTVSVFEASGRPEMFQIISLSDKKMIAIMHGFLGMKDTVTLITD